MFKVYLKMSLAIGQEFYFNTIFYKLIQNGQ